jgi:hypothetical protein
MCIIIVKNKKVEMPSDSILQNCWKNNHDGAGFMYHDRATGEVVIEKGFMKLKHLKKALKAHKFGIEDTVAIHFRYATAGGISKANTHPFPLSKNVKELRQTTFRTKSAMVHNGMLGAGKGNLSDTMIFVRDILSDPLIHNNLSRSAVLQLLGYYMGNGKSGYGNRIAVMTKEKVTLLGATWIEEDDGLWYSNSDYKVSKVYTSTSKSWKTWSPAGASTSKYAKDDTEIGEVVYDDNGVGWDAYGVPVCPTCDNESDIVSEHWGLYECFTCGTLFQDDGTVLAEPDGNYEEEDEELTEGKGAVH